MKRKTNLFLIIITVVILVCACASNSTPDIQQTPAETAAPVENSEAVIPQMSEDAIGESVPDELGSNEPAGTLETHKTQDNAPVTPIPVDETLQVYIFDVGQADCALIKTDNHAMLIDAGNTGQDSLILGYLADTGVTRLDYLVATHPHADHIGSMAAVIRAMDGIDTLLMPDVIHTTSTFENMLDAIEEKDVPVILPEPGDTFEMGGVRIQTLAPNSGGYTDLNNYSIVLRVEYGSTVFLFTGDAEDISENEQLEKGFDLSADVLKVGHHGSNSSSTQKYLAAVTPDYAIISCGKNNSYGHPHSETLSRLAEYTSAIYRTDQNGTIVFTTDGSTVSISTEREASLETPDTSITDTPNDQLEKPGMVEISENTESYIGNKNSKIFHLPSCNTLPAEKNRVYFSGRDEAVNGQYRPCKKCNP